jgi:hypothetical protein
MIQWVGAGSAEHGVGKTTRPDCTLDTNPPKAKSQKAEKESTILRCPQQQPSRGWTRAIALQSPCINR